MRESSSVLRRERHILDALHADGSVRVADLSEQLGVSKVTIRRDLDRLAQQTLLQRSHGGATTSSDQDEGPFADRLLVDAPAKRAIARIAAERVRDGDVIALDNSTTAHHLAQHLLRRKGLLVVTQSLPTASLLVASSDAEVFVPGGTVRRASRGLVGSLDDALEERGRIATAFVGTVALSTRHGLLDLAPAEAEMKRHLIDAADRVIALFASTKTSGFAVHPFATPRTPTEFITDADASDDFVARWEALDVVVSRVHVTDEDYRPPWAAPTARRTTTRDLN